MVEEIYEMEGRAGYRRKAKSTVRELAHNARLMSVLLDFDMRLDPFRSIIPVICSTCEESDVPRKVIKRKQFLDHCSRVMRAIVEAPKPAQVEANVCYYQDYLGALLELLMYCASTAKYMRCMDDTRKRDEKKLKRHAIGDKGFPPYGFELQDDTDSAILGMELYKLGFVQLSLELLDTEALSTNNRCGFVVFLVNLLRTLPENPLEVWLNIKPNVFSKNWNILVREGCWGAVNALSNICAALGISFPGIEAYQNKRTSRIQPYRMAPNGKALAVCGLSSCSNCEDGNIRFSHCGSCGILKYCSRGHQRVSVPSIANLRCYTYLMHY